MWVLGQHSYLSIVQHREDRGLLLVRGRVRADVEHFGHSVGVPVFDRPGGDYPFGAVASRDQVLDYLDLEVREIDYDNFKNRVVDTLGERRAMLYGRVWSVLSWLGTGWTS